MTEYNGEQIDAVLDRIEDLTAKCDKLVEAIEYILDGYGLDAPDFKFKDGEEGDWITDHLLDTLRVTNGN